MDISNFQMQTQYVNVLKGWMLAISNRLYQLSLQYFFDLYFISHMILEHDVLSYKTSFFIANQLNEKIS